MLGSLIYCALFWPASEQESIAKLGFNDSKQLKESDRESLLEKISSHPSIGWVVEELSASFVSQVLHCISLCRSIIYNKEMLRPSPVSLNELSYEAVVKALSQIRDAQNAPLIGDIYVDTVGN